MLSKNPIERPSTEDLLAQRCFQADTISNQEAEKYIDIANKVYRKYLKKCSMIPSPFDNQLVFRSEPAQTGD